jgi:hypothetical protein
VKVVCDFFQGAVHVLLESSGVCTLDVLCFLILDSYVLLEKKNIADCRDLLIFLTKYI